MTRLQLRKLKEGVQVLLESGNSAKVLGTGYKLLGSKEPIVLLLEEGLPYKDCTYYKAHQIKHIQDETQT